MNALAYMVIASGWLAWILPFFLFKSQSQKAQKIDPRARWGILLVGVSYSALWQTHFWERAPALWQFALAILFFLIAAVLSWTAKLALGSQWRLDAGLNSDHELITSGPYKIVRHPIYTSMLCVLLGSGVLITPWWLLLIAVAVFIAGTEIRVHVEDRLLAFFFSEDFREYKRRVRAYIPFVR